MKQEDLLRIGYLSQVAVERMVYGGRDIIVSSGKVPSCVRTLGPPFLQNVQVRPHLASMTLVGRVVVSAPPKSSLAALPEDIVEGSCTSSLKQMARHTVLCRILHW